MEKKSFVLKGNIVYSGENKELCSIEGGYVVCENGICRGAFEKLPKQYETLPLTDYGDKIILPGMTDLHVHAPQYTFRALGMDLELLDWLNVHTFPEEAKYVDISYAKRAYGSFVSDLKHSLTTRACIFATLHREATVALMDLLKEHGVYVAHCPESNLNLSSGIAPVRKFLEEGIAVGLGSDVAGGSSLSMAKALTLAVQVSKMYWRLIDEKSKPLTFAEAFYLATAGGGSYFGKVGTFLDGYEFDAVVAEDHIAKDVREYTPIQRTERMMYDESTMTICAKYAAGCACEL